MKYTIEREPLYYLECINIIANIRNGRSITAEIDDIAERRGQGIRRVVEPLFKVSVDLETHIRDNIRYDIAGFEKDGEELAAFLFKTWERLGNEPVSAIYFYNMFLDSGDASSKSAKIGLYSFDPRFYKEYAILAFFIEEIFMSDVWETNAKLPDLSIPNFFFTLIDEAQGSGAEKYEVLKLYHNFERYCDYANKLIEQASGLYKEKMPGFSDALNVCMDFVEKQMEKDSVGFMREKFSLTIDDGTHYHLHPSAYTVNSCSVFSVSYLYAHVVFGMQFFEISSKIVDRPEYGDEELREFLKIIADGSKLSILRLLKTGPMYGSQLAEGLGLTGATISHHMNILLGRELVRAVKEYNKVFFELNKEKVRQYLDGVDSLI